MERSVRRGSDLAIRLCAQTLLADTSQGRCPEALVEQLTQSSLACLDTRGRLLDQIALNGDRRIRRLVDVGMLPATLQ